MNEITTKAAKKTVRMSRPALNDFWKKINRLNKRAERLNVEPITVSVNNWYSHEFENGKVTEVADVTVTLNIPVSPNWTFAATLDHSHSENILRTSPGFEGQLPDLFRASTSDCQHCNKIRNRKDTFVVQNTDGSFKQVGRDCLLNYLPLGVTPEHAADFAELISAMTYVNNTEDDIGDEGYEGGYGGGREDRFSLLTFLSFVTASVNKCGFRTRKQSEIDQIASTRADATFSMFPPVLSHADQQKLLQPGVDEINHAQTIIDWAKDIEVKSDFDHNIKTIASDSAISGRDAGLAAYLYMGHQKHLGWVAKRKQENEGRPESKHFGELKVRAKKQTIVYMGCPYSGETDWGYTFIYKFSIDGSDLVWSTGNELSFDGKFPQPGDELEVDFTPVDHGDFRDRPQTKINRVKIHSLTLKEKENA